MRNFVLILGVIALSIGLTSPSSARDYKARWDQVGGSWTTGWVHQSPSNPTYGTANANKCGHFHNPGSTCAGGYAGWYTNGQVTSFWPRGCGGPRWRIRCTVRSK